jgi:hypothetical protein
VGAHESGAESMKFGLTASLGSSVAGGASTTPSAPPSAYVLSVGKPGSGSGTVSSPAGINCGPTCSATLASGTAVTLTASAASGSTFAGWGGACAGTGLCTVTMSSAVSVSATFNAAASASGGVNLSTASLSFGGSMPDTQTVTYTNNTGSRVTFVQASISSARFGQANTCGDVASGASCSATVTYYPTNSGSDSGTFTMTSTAPNSPHAVILSAGGNATVSQPSLITHFYRSILRREADASGKAYWEGEVARMTGMGANVNEVWYAMAAAFFFSPEYVALGRDGPGFLTDLYTTFFNRAPDASGLGFWSSQLASGMPREVTLAAFLFSPEFSAFATAMTGGGASRVEVDVVLDFYRGLLARLPDAAGFTHWLQQFRAAQCQGPGAVYAVMESISAAFMNSPEFAGRGRSNPQFVGDLYNAFLRRGGDLNGVQFWINQLAGGVQSAHQVRQAFINSPEIGSRVTAIVAQGCQA